MHPEWIKPRPHSPLSNLFLLVPIGMHMNPDDVLQLFDACAGEMYSTVFIHRTDSEWQKILPPDVFRVARKAGTERPFSGIYTECDTEGVYACACCGTHLFHSDDKFVSKTGWPSFSRPVSPGNVALHPNTSHGMLRTEVLCCRCKAHLGHVFDDGPLPDGMRYCINSLSLSLIACETEPSDTI